MKDRTLKLFLLIAFGAGGLVILWHTWLIPGALAERLVTSILALLGWAYAWLLR